MKLESLKYATEKSKEWPTWYDLQKEVVYIQGSIRNDLTQIMINLLRNRVCVLRGSEGRGKTVLARKIGYDLRTQKDKWTVWHLDISTYTERDEIPALTDFDDEKTLIIIENAHSFPEVARQLLEAFEKISKARFLFTTRWIGDEDLFGDRVDKSWYWDIEPDIDTIKGLIEHYKTTLGLTSYKPSSGLEIQKWIEENIASNLRRLKWFLEAWEDKVNTALHGVNREKVIEHVYKKIIDPLEPEEQRAFFKISAVFQFDVEVHGFSFQSEEGYFKKLCKKGLVYENIGYYRLAHPTDAAYIVEAYAYGKSLKNVSKEVSKILQEYFEHSPDNYYKLIVALHREERDLLREIILKDTTFNAIENQAKNESNVGWTFSVIEKINWADKERGKKLWASFKALLGSNQEEQKKNLLERLQKIYLCYITRSVSSLKRTSQTEGKWLADIILEERSLSEKAEESSFGTILRIINLFKTLLCSEPKVKVFIKNLNPVSLAQKAKKTKRSLMWAGWILQIVYKDYPDFVKKCLQEIGEHNLLDLAKTSSPTRMKNLWKIIRGVDPALYHRLRQQLTPDDWLNIYKQNPFEHAALGNLYRLCETNRDFAEKIVQALANEDLGSLMQKLYARAKHDKSIAPMGKFGRFLHSSWRTGDIDTRNKIAEKVVKGMNFSCKYTLEEVSYVLTAIRRCNNPGAFIAILDRVRSEVPLESFITIPLDRGLPCIIWELYNNEPTKSYSMELTNKITQLSFENLLKQSEPRAVSSIIWNMLQINRDQTGAWVIRDMKLWIDKIKCASTIEAFWLLWSLYQLDRNFSKQVATEDVPPMVSSLTQLIAEDLPLLGLINLFEIPLFQSFNIDPDVVADELSKNPSASEIFFVTRFFSKQTALIEQRFLQQLTKYLFWRYPKYCLDGLKGACPLEQATEVFQKILDRSSIFKEMICLTHTYMKNRNSRSVPLGKLIDNFLAPPNRNPLFENRVMAREWIRMTIEEKIYHTKTVRRRNIPGRPISEISLNYSNPLVSSVLGI